MSILLPAAYTLANTLNLFKIVSKIKLKADF